MGDRKPYINLVVIGNVNTGKSTMTSHLIFKCGGVDRRTMDLCEREATAIGKSYLKYAWLLDQLAAEREQELSMENTLWRLDSPKYQFTIIDTPGHVNFVSNTITAMVTADVALLVIDATDDSFGKGIFLDGETWEDIMIMKRLIVVINKMDAVNYSKDRYDQVKSRVSIYLSKIIIDLESTHFIPISGWDGDNMIDKSIKMPWYTGPSLLKSLDSIFPPERPPIDRPFRMPILDVYQIGGLGTVVTGLIETGSIRPGVSVKFTPSGIVAKVISIEMHHEAVTEAAAGDNVGLNIDMDANRIHRGDIIVIVSNTEY